ncbi:MAG: hydrogenase large subunit, partial [Crenarchaeota archaeon]|nr:hydrogenase large subunit [Thermoproteota archaeon]
MKNEVTKIFKKGAAPVEGLNGELYLEFDEKDLSGIIKNLSKNSFELLSLFCVENFTEEGFTLFYIFEKTGCEQPLVLNCKINDNQATSIAKTYASACWYEREVTDGFGVKFKDAFDTRHLFLHEVYPKEFHPLLKSFKNQKIQTEVASTENGYVFKELEGEGVYQIPVGPVHAGIIEPGHFRFSVIGESIFNLEVRMFYKHRGIEKIAEGKTP